MILVTSSLTIPINDQLYALYILCLVYRICGLGDRQLAAGRLAYACIQPEKPTKLACVSCCRQLMRVWPPPAVIGSAPALRISRHRVHDVHTRVEMYPGVCTCLLLCLGSSVVF